MVTQWTARIFHTGSLLWNEVTHTHTHAPPPPPPPPPHTHTHSRRQNTESKVSGDGFKVHYSYITAGDCVHPCFPNLQKFRDVGPWSRQLHWPYPGHRQRQRRQQKVTASCSRTARLRWLLSFCLSTNVPCAGWQTSSSYRALWDVWRWEL